MPDVDAMTNELEAAKELARQAGAILLKYFEEKTSVRWKGEGSPVTDADESASRFIVEALHRRFPSDGVLCEEEQDDLDRLKRSRVWIVDPMDGTSEFVAGRTEFAVMIGLAVDGKPRIGVVYLPIERKLYFAERGGGAFLEVDSLKNQLRVSGEADPARATIVASRSHDSSDSQRIRELLRIGTVVRAGGVGLKVGMICERHADLYLHAGSGTNEWDTCAPQIILDEANGRMTDVFNMPLRYNTRNPRNLHGLIASNGVLHDHAVNVARLVLRQSGKGS